MFYSLNYNFFFQLVMAKSYKARIVLLSIRKVQFYQPLDIICLCTLYDARSHVHLYKNLYHTHTNLLTFIYSYMSNSLFHTYDDYAANYSDLLQKEFATSLEMRLFKAGSYKLQAHLPGRSFNIQLPSRLCPYLHTCMLLCSCL